MRPAHLLRDNKATTRPTRIILFDTETAGTPLPDGSMCHTLKLGVACFWRRRGNGDVDTVEWYDFTRAQELWDWVSSKIHEGTRTVLSSHNLSFDLPVLDGFQWLPTLGFELKGFYAKGLTTLARFKGLGATLEFVDNTNFFATSLDKLGELVGLPKLEVDFSTASDRELRTYCRRDVEILLRLWQLWFAFLTTHDLGQWYRTLPSQAFGAFRHRFMSSKVWIHSHEKTLFLERSAYHGGRVECLRVGTFTDGPFYKLDVNSMYPSVMRRFSYPVALYHYEENPTLSYLGNKLKRYHVIAHCRITTGEPAFPVLVGGHLVYPVGTFDASLTTEELRYLLSVGSVDQVYRLAYYRGAPIFRDYVDYFYPLKVRYDREGNAPFRTITKGFLNFLYGKFGQRGLQDKVMGPCDPGDIRVVDCIDLETQERYELIYIAGRIIRRRHTDESYNSFPAIAAEVTANARLYLHHLIETAHRQNVYYVDTDSLIVNREGYDYLIGKVHDTQLGALKLEGTADYLQIRAPKDYTFGTKTRIKGIRTNAHQLAPNVYRQDRFSSIQGMLREGQLNTVTVTQTTKVLRRTITSGLVDPDGFVRPFQRSPSLLSPPLAPPPSSSPRPVPF